MTTLNKCELTRMLNEYPIQTRSKDGKTNYSVSGVGPLILVQKRLCKIAGPEINKIRNVNFVHIKFVYNDEPCHFSVPLQKYEELTSGAFLAQ